MRKLENGTLQNDNATAYIANIARWFMEQAQLQILPNEHV